MDFSKPENARKINRLKVLNTLRGREDVTRAELSRILLINKVSISEIVAFLIKEGLIVEAGRKEIDSGRPATILKINNTGNLTLVLEVGDKGAFIAASNLSGRITRLERFSRGKDEKEFLHNLQLSLDRLLKNEQDKIISMAVVTNEDLSYLKKSFDFPLVGISPLEAQIRSEELVTGKSLEGMLFVNLGTNVEAAFKRNGQVLRLRSLGKMKISKGQMDQDGEEGTLDAFFSAYAFKKRMEAISGRPYEERELVRDSSALKLIKESLKALSLSLTLAIEALDADSVMLTGVLSDLPDEYYAAINTTVHSSLDKKKKDVFVFKSVAGEKGRLEGGANLALDEMFYKKSLLEGIKKLENYD